MGYSTDRYKLHRNRDHPVLARGMRPTVERVRTELGRGSPARVGQLLERWWDALAKRLAGETRLPELPGEVATAFTTVWSIASAHGMAGAQHALSQAAQALDTEKAALAVERTRWVDDLETAHREAANAKDACSVAERRVVDQQQLIETLRRELQDLATQRDGAQARVAQVERDLARIQGRLESQEAVMAKEREALASHVRKVEDRAHAEVDRAREETKTLRVTATNHERDLRGLRDILASERRQHSAALRAAEREAATQAARAATLAEHLHRGTASKPAVDKPTPPKRTLSRKPSTRPGRRNTAR